MTDNLFASLNEHMAEKEAGAERAYQEKILKKIYAELRSEDSFVADRREAGDEFDMVWFNDMEYIPIKLFAKKKVAVAPAHLIRPAGLTTTALWSEYCAVKDIFPAGTQVALIFPIERMTQFVIHNALDLPVSDTYPTVNRPVRGVHFRAEPLLAFLEALSSRAPA